MKPAQPELFDAGHDSELAEIKHQLRRLRIAMQREYRRCETVALNSQHGPGADRIRERANARAAALGWVLFHLPQ